MSARKRMPGPLALAFGRVVKDLRLRKQLSISTVAMDAEITNERISEIESGADEPTLVEIFRLAVALDVHADELVRRAVEAGRQP